MHVSSIPSFDPDPYSVLSFIAPLRPLKPRRKDGSDVLDKYKLRIEQFVSAVTTAVLGVPYSNFIGKELPSKSLLLPNEPGPGFYADITLWIPAGYSTHNFKQIVAAEWAQCSAADAAMFFRSQPAEKSRLRSNNAYGNRRNDWWQQTFGNT